MFTPCFLLNEKKHFFPKKLIMNNYHITIKKVTLKITKTELSTNSGLSFHSEIQQLDNFQLQNSS